jgi:hypothetical protein
MHPKTYATPNDTVPGDTEPAALPDVPGDTEPAALPDVPVGSMFERKRLLWFGGLAAAGTLGVLQWPVVIAVGAGTVVAERFARDGLTGPAS